jgi:hypothetical protein
MHMPNKNYIMVSNTFEVKQSFRCKIIPRFMGNKIRNLLFEYGVVK